MHEGDAPQRRQGCTRCTVPHQITEDHTLINAQLKAGQITAEEAKTATYGNVITRAVGVKDHVEVDVFELACGAGDRFVLCSDGIHGYLETEAELTGLCANRTRAECAKVLVDHALERGGKDNATVIVIDIIADPPPAAQTQE